MSTPNNTKPQRQLYKVGIQGHSPSLSYDIVWLDCFNVVLEFLIALQLSIGQVHKEIGKEACDDKLKDKLGRCDNLPNQSQPKHDSNQHDPFSVLHTLFGYL